MKTFFLLPVLLTAVILQPASCRRANKTLRDSILNQTDIHIRPLDTTTVELAFVLTAMNKLDSVDQELGTTFLLYMAWTDPRLTWTPGETDPDTIIFYMDEIWTPPLVVSNAIEDSVFLLRKDTFPARVNSNGRVTWIPRLSPTTTCGIDTSYFPVDSQDCDISITSWVHSTDELVLVEGSTPHYPDPINLDDYTADKSWKLIDTSVKVSNLTGGYGIEYNNVDYRFHFRRNDKFYKYILVVPGICLSFLQILVFLIPLNEKDTRVTYASTLLLSLIFYTSLLSQILPPIFGEKNVIGDSFFNVMIFGTFITGVIVLEVVWTSIVKKLHRQDEKDAKDDNTGIIIVAGGKCAAIKTRAIACLKSPTESLFKLMCLATQPHTGCWKCISLQVFNAALFILFLIVYFVGVGSMHEIL